MSVFPIERRTFFLDKLCQFYFVLHSTRTGYTPYQVWFSLDNSITQSKF